MPEELLCIPSNLWNVEMDQGLKQLCVPHELFAEITRDILTTGLRTTYRTEN